METRELVAYIQGAKKRTPIKVYLKRGKGAYSVLESAFTAAGCQVFGSGDLIIFGEWEAVSQILERHKEEIQDSVIECDCRNRAIPLYDIKNCNARIEPGAIIREQVEIGNHAVIMMGAVINVGAVIGEGTMVDMNAVLGGRAIVGKNCHIGAGSVIAGVIEPPGARPVVIEDHVLIGANAVVIEGVRIGEGAVVAAGAVVIKDVEKNMVVAGVPARVIKKKDAESVVKTEILQALREL